MRNYPQSHLIKADAYSVMFAWGLFVVTALLFVAGNVLSAPISNVALGISFFAFTGAAALHVALALSHSCPSCGKHPTVQGFRPIHQNAVPASGVSGWARVIWSTLRERKFVCIHCGEAWRVTA